MLPKLFFLMISLLLSLDLSLARPKISLDERENIRIYKDTSPAVVNISSIAVNYDFFYRPMPSEAGSGTGFFIDQEGHIVTNYHVIEGAQELIVTMLDENKQPTGKVKARDLAGKSDLLFRRNSVTGTVECLTNKSAVELNHELHASN